jgi:hypothetical protein
MSSILFKSEKPPQLALFNCQEKVPELILTSIFQNYKRIPVQIQYNFYIKHKPPSYDIKYTLTRQATEQLSNKKTSSKSFVNIQ